MIAGVAIFHLWRQFLALADALGMETDTHNTDEPAEVVVYTGRSMDGVWVA